MNEISGIVFEGFIDRAKNEPESKHVDVIMLTLDAENFLKPCLFSAYKEIPIRKLIVCDGDSKDKTIEILKKFPRVELFIKPEFRTTGKCLEFLFSKTETEWYVLIDGDLVLSPGWYDEMCKGKKQYDVIENSRRTSAYHFFKEDPTKLESDSRALSLCHLIKKSALDKYKCDDDYMWRQVDVFMRQVVENNGFKYGKLDSTNHIHHETQRIQYESDNEKNFQKIVFKEPEYVIIDKKKADAYNIKHAQSIVKYLDPDGAVVKNNIRYDFRIRILDKKWVEKTNPKWLPRYKRVTTIRFKIKYFVYHKLLPRKIKNKIKQIIKF